MAVAGFKYRASDYGGYEVVGFEDAMATRLAIPSERDGVPIVGIGECAFEKMVFLTSVTIPQGVCYIRQGAFQGCSALKSVRLPSGLTTLERHAFDGCKALRTIIFEGERVPSDVHIPGGVAIRALGVSSATTSREYIDGDAVLDHLASVRAKEATTYSHAVASYVTARPLSVLHKGKWHPDLVRQVIDIVEQTSRIDQRHQALSRIAGECAERDMMELAALAAGRAADCAPLSKCQWNENVEANWLML